jgi:choline dehydrogenase-like flavoprotein
MPRVRINWAPSELELRTIEFFAQTLADYFEASGLGTINIDMLRCLNNPAEFSELVHPAFHHIGATRMHQDPAQGVVDPDCRVHGMTNLWIGSSSVFPTSGFSNPTMTIVALCLRLADRLKGELT